MPSAADTCTWSFSESASHGSCGNRQPIGNGEGERPSKLVTGLDLRAMRAMCRLHGARGYSSLGSTVCLHRAPACAAMQTRPVLQAHHLLPAWHVFPCSPLWTQHIRLQPGELHKAASYLDAGVEGHMRSRDVVLLHMSKALLHPLQGFETLVRIPPPLRASPQC